MSEDVETVRHIMEIVPGASAGFMDGRCIRLDLSDPQSQYDGLLRQSYRKQEVMLLVAKLLDLQHLDLRKNVLRQIPYLGHLQNLQYLDISSNDLSTIPQWVACFKQLRYLDVSVNGVYMLPNLLGELRNLEVLKASGNKIIKLQEEMQLWNLTRLRVLDLSDNSFGYFSEIIWQFRELEELYWGPSYVQIIPPAIERLKKLRKLMVVQSNVTGIPKEVCRLKNLRSLILAKNRIDEVHEEIGGLSSLEELSLYHNKIVTLPESFYALKLDRLNLDKNPLEESCVSRLNVWKGWDE